MSSDLPLRVFLRRGRRALRLMTDLQRAIFLDARMKGLSHDQLAQRHGITATQAEAEFAAALHICLRTLRKLESWWRRLSHRL